jgi:hypothetical protein
MPDLNLLISQLSEADEIAEGLISEQGGLVEELRSAIRDATVCAYRLRLSRDLAAAAAAGRLLDNLE